MAAPMQQQPNQQMPPQAPPQPTLAQKDIDIDPIAKVKQNLLPRLKESLVALMKVAGQILQQNSMTEDGHKPMEGLQLSYEKSIEDFYSICDQLEINLHLALEMQVLQADSAKYTPLPVTAPKSDPTSMADQQSIPYSQYLVIVKQQISLAKEMYDQLSEFMRNFGKT